MYVCVYINVKLFVCINLMAEGVDNIIYIFNRRPILVYKVKLVTLVKGDPGLLHFTLDLYLILLSAKQGGIKCYF